LPGGLIGALLGILIGQNSKLALASISLLRIGQWAPFVIWWVLVKLFFVPFNQPLTPYFFDWTMSIPAVALGVCYYFLSTKHLLRLDWRASVFASAGMACYRALFISIVLALSIWPNHWVVIWSNDNIIKNYVGVCVLALFLMVVNWTYRSGIDQSAVLHRETLLADLRCRREVSFWTATLIVVLFVIVWQMLNLVGVFRVSLANVLKVTTTLFSEAEIWQNTLASLREIVAGIMFSCILVVIISRTLLINGTITKWTLALLSLTFAIPILVLPVWQGALLYQDEFIWHATTVACLSFYPLMQTGWILREEPLLCRICLAADQALPYAFSATLWSQMMSASAGLGFAVIVASATSETEKASAIFLITLSLMLVLSLVFRLLARKSDLFVRSDVFPDPREMKPSNSP
jgi:ABC-type nitrate/sulfonate/bicarbonate transport system permease component